MNAVNYEAIRQQNIEEYGKGTRHLAYLSDLYENRTHFLYELLQNAEDALAKRENQGEVGYVEIQLYNDRLELRHNGKPFDELDVFGICGIGEGTKAGDYSQIGKFGIGFKSVYAYTLAPRIHSNGEHFEVRRFVEPHALSENATPTDIKAGETCIVLPFDPPAEEKSFRAYISPRQAVDEIGEALKRLGLRTLLFLRRIDEVRWTLQDGLQGVFRRKTTPLEGNSTARYVEVTDWKTTETWLVFQRDAQVTDEGKSHKVAVEIGYLILDGKVICASDTELVVSFPTAKRTELGFLIQGPFKTTKARDNIEGGSETEDNVGNASKTKPNRQLITTAAQLAADSLEDLRDLGLLDVSSFKALPLKSKVFEDRSTKFFLPVYQAIREVLKSKCLLPRHEEGFVAANQARLARGAQLAEVFSPEQLGVLFGGDQISWLNTAITADRMPELHAYIAGRRKLGTRNEWEQEPLVEGIEVEAKDLASKLTEPFFQKQDDSWITKFYEYLSKNFEPYRNSLFIRLESGRHVNASQAFLPPNDLSGIDSEVFPLVKQSLLKNKDCLEFLREKAKLREPDAADVVIKCLLPKYRTSTFRFDETEYEHDLKRIVDACGGEARQRMVPELKATKFIACTHAGRPELDEIIWKAPGDQGVFIRTLELDAWFSGNDQDVACFIHSSAKRILYNQISDLEVARLKPLRHCDPTARGKVHLVSDWGSHKQGLDGFNPEASLVGLQYALQHCNLDRAKYLWSVLLGIPHLIKGDIQNESNANRLDAAPRIPTFSKLGQACVDTAWLPDKASITLCAPKQLLLSDLPDGFESTSIFAKEVAEKLGMKQPEQEQALAKLGQGDPRRMKMLEKVACASEDELAAFEKLVPKEIEPQPAPSFKDGLRGLSRSQRGKPIQGSTRPSPVSNPDRYQKNLDANVEDSVKAHLSFPRIVTFSPVRDATSSAVARKFLYMEYQGRCQVTGQTFPKASANAEGEAENYFEACALLSNTNAEYLNDPGNMLCVSADTMAKLKHASIVWEDDMEDVIERFQGSEPGNMATAHFLLAGEKARITWSQRHFMHLIALWNKA